MRNCVRLLSIICLCITACTSLSISPPDENQRHATPVDVRVIASADIEPGSFRARLDGIDVSSAFTLGHGSASASLPAATGPHTLEASANVWNWFWRTYLSNTAKTRHFDAAIIAPPPSGSVDLQLASSVVAIAPGSTELLPVTIQRFGAFTGQVDVSTTLGSLVIHGNTYFGSLPLRAPATAKVSQTQTSVLALGSLNGAVVQDREPLMVRVSHRPGIFAAATVVVKRDLQSATGPDGVTTLLVQNGPPGARRFQARFRDANVALGSPIDFDPGTPDFGGGGFCTAGRGGFVISGGSAAADHEVSVILFDDPGAPRRFSIAATAPGSTNVVQPMLLFSPSCQVLVMIGADADASRHLLFRAEVQDLVQRKRICSVTSISSQFQVQLLPPAAGNQVLRVSAGGQQTDCPIF